MTAPPVVQPAAAEAGQGDGSERASPPQGRAADRQAVGWGPTDWWVALALLALAAGVRLPAFAPESLWRDDAWQVLAVRAESLSDLATYGVTSPGFAAVLALVLRLPGPVEVLAQSVPLALGCLLPAALHLAARRLGAGRAGSATAGGLLALSASAAVYSTRVKPYTFDAILVLIVLLLAGLLLRSPCPRRWRRLLVTVAIVALLAAQALIAGGVAVAICLLRPSSRRAIGNARALLTLPLASAVLAYVWYVRPSTSNVPLRESWDRLGRYTEPSSAGLWEAWQRLLPGLLPHSAWPGTPADRELVARIALAVLLAAVVLAVRGGRGWLVALALAPAAVLLAGSVFGRVPFGARVDIPFYPGLLLALALGFPQRRVVGRWWRAASVLGGTAAVLATAPATAQAVDVSYPQDHFRPLVAALTAQRAPDEWVLVDTIGTYPVAAYGVAPFHVRRSPDTYTGFAVVPEESSRLLVSTEPGSPQLQLARLHSLIDRRESVWVVETAFTRRRDDAQHLRRGPDATVYTRALRSSGAYSLCSRQDWPGVRLTLWRPTGRC